MHALDFIQRTFLWFVPVVFVSFALFLGMVRKKGEERWEGSPRGRCWSVKYKSVEIYCSKEPSWIQMLPSEIANPDIKLWDIVAQQSFIKPKYKAHTFYEALHGPINPIGPTLWCQPNLDYSYSLSNCCCNGVLDSRLWPLWDEVYGDFSVNPIVVHMNWEELNNHQFLRVPPLVQESFNEATTDLISATSCNGAVWVQSYQ